MFEREYLKRVQECDLFLLYKSRNNKLAIYYGKGKGKYLLMLHIEVIHYFVQQLNTFYTVLYTYCTL